MQLQLAILISGKRSIRLGYSMYTFRVEIYTDGLLIIGSYDLPLYRRVSDALNSRLHRYITLYDTTIAPQSRPNQIQRVPQMLVDWGRALLVATLEEPEPPEDYQPNATLARNSQSMMFFTLAFALRASLHKRPDLDLGQMLDQLTDDFIPLSDAQIFPLVGGQPVTRRFVCLHRDQIQAMYTLDAAATPKLAPAAQPAPAETLADEQMTSDEQTTSDEASEADGAPEQIDSDEHPENAE